MSHAFNDAETSNVVDLKMTDTDESSQQNCFAENLGEARDVLQLYINAVRNFHKAIHSGDPEALQKALAWTSTITFKLDVNDSCDLDNQTVLHKVCKTGKADLLPVLIDAGADINSKYFYHGVPCTALHIACQGGHLKIVSQLLDARADVNILIDGCSPLHTACVSGNVSIVTKLLEHGCDLNEKSQNNLCQNCLHATCGKGARGSVEVARKLIELGIDTTERDSSGCTALHLACMSGLSAVIPVLSDAGIDVNARCADGMVALHIACESDEADCVLELVKVGCDLDAKNSNEETALEMACDDHLEEIVTILLEEGADINIVDDLGTKALDSSMSSFVKTRQSIVRKLVDAGAEVNVSNIPHQKVLSAFANNKFERKLAKEALKEIQFEDIAEIDEVLDFLFRCVDDYPQSLVSDVGPASVQIKPPESFPGVSQFAHLIDMY